MVKPLAIPYALSAFGAPVAATDENLRQGRRCDCRCPGCNAPLILKRGPVKQTHFAHDAGYTPDHSCFESSAHLACKDVLAKAAGQLLILPPTREPSAQGIEPWQMNPAFTVQQAEIERRFALPNGGAHRQVDVALTDISGRTLAVEIAVTNRKGLDYIADVASIGLPAVECVVPHVEYAADLPTAQEILKAAQWLWEPYSIAAVNRIRAQFDAEHHSLQGEVDKIAKSAPADPDTALKRLLSSYQQLSDLQPADCSQDRQRQCTADRINKGIQWAVNAMLPQTKSKILPIRADKFGSFLRKDTARTINYYAGRIHRAGLRQANQRKPALFSAKFAGYTVYVDLGGTEIMRIWETDCVPAIYAFPDNGYARECLIEAIADLLEKSGVPTRRHFEDISHFD